MRALRRPVVGWTASMWAQIPAWAGRRSTTSCSRESRCRARALDGGRQRPLRAPGTPQRVLAARRDARHASWTDQVRAIRAAQSTRVERRCRGRQRAASYAPSRECARRREQADCLRGSTAVGVCRRRLTRGLPPARSSRTYGWSVAVDAAMFVISHLPLSF